MTTAPRGQRLANAIGLYMTGIRDGKPREAVDRFIGDRYTQHSTGVPDGKEGFIEFFEPFLERNPERDIRVLRGLEDGRRAFVHAYQNLNGGQAEWVTMDFFDTDAAGKIVEHWDVIAAYSPKTPSGHSSIDGPTDVADLAATESNKAVVRELIEQCLMRGGDVERVSTLVAAGYTQHNAEVPDGLEAFRSLLVDPQRPLFYQDIVLLVGQGNFVATLSKATWNGEPYAQADLFRLENGKVVEHWDAAEPALPGNVNSGKF